MYIFNFKKVDELKLILWMVFPYINDPQFNYNC